MRLHTNLSGSYVTTALRRAQDKDLITRDVHFTVFEPHRSMTHPHGYEIQLGTYDQDSLPDGYQDQRGANMRVRRVRNASHGEARFAATWHEWGWLIAEIFAADPGARFGPDPAKARYAYGYASPADFGRKTHGEFDLRPASTPLIYTRNSTLHIPTS